MRTFLVLLLMMLSLNCCNTAQANALDHFRDVIESRKFTIKYTVEHHYPKSILNVTDLSVIKTDKYIDYTVEYIMVSNDDDFFSEILSSSKYDIYNGKCVLRKNNKVYYFSHSTTNSSMPYKSYNTRTVELNIKPKPATDKHKILNSKYIGSMMTAINALYPDKPKTQYERVYHLVKTGTNDEGLSYFDLKADESEDNTNYFNFNADESSKPVKSLNVIRYYFNGDELVKIAMGDYTIDAQGNRRGYRQIITITKFSPEPTQSYLSLPSELHEVGESQ